MAGGMICTEDSADDYDLVGCGTMTKKTFRSLDGGETFEELAEMPEERKTSICPLYAIIAHIYR